MLKVWNATDPGNQGGRSWLVWVTQCAHIMPDSRLPVIYVSAHVVDECKWATNVYSCKVQKHQNKKRISTEPLIVHLSICPFVHAGASHPIQHGWHCLAKCRRRCNEVCRCFFLIQRSGRPPETPYLNVTSIHLFQMLSNLISACFSTLSWCMFQLISISVVLQEQVCHTGSDFNILWQPCNSGLK